MRRILTRAQAIKYAVYIILAAAIITIFPLRLWNEKISTSGNEHGAASIHVGDTDVAMQQFTAEYSHLDEIGVFLEGEYDGDTLTLRVFDKNFYLIREQTASVSGAGYAYVYINLETKVGETYYYTLEGAESDFWPVIELTANSGTNNNGYLQYGDETREAYNIITKYVYEQPVRKLPSLGIIAGLILAGIIFSLIMNALSKKIPALGELCTMRWIIGIIGNPVVVLAAIAVLICIIPLHLFSIYIADIIVLSLGTVILAVTLLYIINRGNPYSEGDIEVYFKENYQNILQSVFIALGIMACVNYMNGLYEIHHDIEWRRMALYLGLALAVTFVRKELLNIYNILLLIAGSVAGVIYFRSKLPEMTDEYHAEALKLESFLFPLALIIAAYIIRMIILYVRDGIKGEGSGLQKSLKGISWPYTLVTLIMAASMIAMRNTRSWPIMMAVVFGTVTVRFFFWEKRGHFLNNIANGVMLHFFGAVLYCLWYRPWASYTYTRYPFIFHTVTETACYLALVMAVALVKLLHKYNKTHKIGACIYELLFWGISASYLMFTTARTGVLAISASGVVCWIVMISGREESRRSFLFKLKHLAISAGLIVLSLVWCFPACFALQKVIPGLVGEPRLMEIEKYPESVVVGTDLTSEDFITFGRFAQVFVHKMAGLPEHTVDLNRYTIYGTEEKYKIMLIRDEDGNIISSKAIINPETDNITGYAENNEADTQLCYGDTNQVKSVYSGVTGLALAENGLCDRGGVYAGIQAQSLSAAPVHLLNLNKDGFVPPKEYSLEGEPPGEWYDENYWYYNPQTGEWTFATWMLEEEAAKSGDASNGRMDIYRAYFEQLNMQGHEGMGALLNDGSEAAHAHDIYLQVAYDHGIIVGAIFLMWVIMTCIQALMVYLRRRSFDPAAGIGLAVSVTYAAAGVTEWISHPCNPVGFVMLLVVVALSLSGRERA